MAPEQTGRMNRSVDSRSDLYALGVTFYEMLTGQLPFTAADPMEWVHCHGLWRHRRARRQLGEADAFEVHERAVTELKRTGTVQPYEREYFRKDGIRVPALIGSAAFDEQRDQGVAFVLDLTERKRAESLLAAEKRILEMLAKGDSLTEILDSLCRLVEEQTNGALASILLLDGDRLQHGTYREGL